MNYCVSFSSNCLPGLVSGPATPAANDADSFLFPFGVATDSFSTDMGSILLEPNDESSGSVMSSSWYMEDGSACSTPTSRNTEMRSEFHNIRQSSLPPHDLCGHGLMEDLDWNDFKLDDQQVNEIIGLSADFDDLPYNHHHQVVENCLPATTQLNALHRIDMNVPESATQKSEDGDAGGVQMVCIHVCSNDPAIHDGYVWRKYGQKDIKGRKFPRSYFKCAQPGCSIKKHTEASSDQDGVMMITYIGRHSHSL